MTGWLLIVSSGFQPQRDGELLARLEGASHYLSTMQQAKQALPIFPQRQNVVHMERYRVVVVYGETGSGKMMQGPQFIIEEFICRGEGSACNVVITQPRRTAAISIAKQVAQERGEELGETVGFQVWISKQLLLSHGGLLFCTVGILLELLKGSPKLRGISHVIVDEVHERDVCTDFLLVLLQGVLKLNRNLRGQTCADPSKTPPNPIKQSTRTMFNKNNKNVFCYLDEVSIGDAYERVPRYKNDIVRCKMGLPPDPGATSDTPDTQMHKWGKLKMTDERWGCYADNLAIYNVAETYKLPLMHREDDEETYNKLDEAAPAVKTSFTLTVSVLGIDIDATCCRSPNTVTANLLLSIEYLFGSIAILCAPIVGCQNAGTG
ncbi:uncharacterized protein LOC144108421 [Amblyomma americanum]